MSDQTDVLQGTLDLLIMRTIALEPMHGWAIAQRIQQISDDLLRVQQGSLYPALHRLEHQGWITAEWGASENNRRARFYALTRPAASSSRPKSKVGAPFSRRQPRAAKDLTVRLLHILRSRCDRSCSATAVNRTLGRVADRPRTRNGASPGSGVPAKTRVSALRLFGGVAASRRRAATHAGPPRGTPSCATRARACDASSATGASPRRPC